MATFDFARALAAQRAAATAKQIEADEASRLAQDLEAMEEEHKLIDEDKAACKEMWRGLEKEVARYKEKKADVEQRETEFSEKVTVSTAHSLEAAR